MSPARRLATLLLTAAAGLALAAPATAGSPVDAGRPPVPAAPVPAREQVVSGSMVAGGYPGPAPAPGGCVAGRYDSNYSETALARRPGTEQLVGGAKAFFSAYSTFKAQHTASLVIDPAGGSGTHPVGGFDCVTTGTQAMPPSWTNVTDPNLEWDTRGRIHQIVLAYNAYWGSVDQPNGNVYAVHSDDGGRTWVTGNGGTPVQAGPNPSTASGNFLDKPWVAVQQNEASPYRDHVYAVWVEFPEDSAAPVLIHSSVSRDRGATWSAPSTVPQPVPTIGANPWPLVSTGANGDVYLSYVTYGSGNAAALWTTRSVDDGASWTGATKVTDTSVLRTCCLPGSKVHDGVVEVLTASRTQPGHLHMVWEEYADGRVRVRLVSSADGGRTWSAPQTVNDDQSPTDQFQPTVATGPDGAVVVAFYDRRWRCPEDPAVVRADRGAANTCIGVTVQAYRDSGGVDTKVGANRRVSRYLWDPNQPAQQRQGLPQRACEDPTVTCDNYFIGDYFDLEVSADHVFILSTSTHYPGPGALSDNGRPIYYQRSVLHTIDRGRLGL